MKRIHGGEINMNKSAVAFALFLMIPMSSAAVASPITYGCDTAADRFSAIQQQVSLKAFSIKGSIQPNEFRKGKYAPLAQIYIESPDEKNRWALKVIALGAKAKAAFIFLDMKDDGKEGEPFPIGTVKIGEKLPFDISVTDGKMIKFKIGGMDGHPEFALGEQAQLNIICSTGDFVFSDLEWSEK
jgi:hypothetical protein